MMIGDALRLLRTRRSLTQTAAAKREGAPDFRTLSQWETRRKLPSMRLLTSYLDSLGCDLHDLQDALDQVNGVPPKRLKNALSRVERRLDAIDWRLRQAGLDAGQDRFPGTGPDAADLIAGG